MLLPTKKLLDLLVAQKLLTVEDARTLELESIQKNLPIDQYLLSHSQIKKEEILKAKSTLLNIPWVDIISIPIAPQALGLVPEVVARKYALIPFELSETEGKIKIAMSDPFDLQAVEFLEKKDPKKSRSHHRFG